MKKKKAYDYTNRFRKIHLTNSTSIHDKTARFTSKLGLEKESLNLLKPSEKTTGHIAYNDEVINTFPVKLGIRQRHVYPHTSV